MKILFITNHRRKVVEIAHVLPFIEQELYDFSELQSLDPEAIVRHKLSQLPDKYNSKNVLVDETGLYLDALGGFPGPFVKWMLASSSPQHIYDITSKLQNMNATAKTCLGLRLSDGTTTLFSAEMKGKIVPESTEKGYGWDSIFKPHGFDITFAEMGVANKKMISMRTTAAEKLLKYLRSKKLLQ